MKIIVIDKKSNKVRLSKLFSLLLYLIGYTISFLLVSLFFDSFELTETYTVLCVSYVSLKMRKVILIICSFFLNFNLSVRSGLQLIFWEQRIALLS